eukprot:3354969-Rhodomonas_salina.1
MSVPGCAGHRRTLSVPRAEKQRAFRGGTHGRVHEFGIGRLQPEEAAEERDDRSLRTHISV